MGYRRQHKKRQYRKRNPLASKPWYMRKYNALQIANHAWEGVKYIKGLINVERHIKDQQATAQTITTSAFVLSFHGIAQGDTIDARTGQSILLKTIQFKANLTKHASVTTDRVRIIVFIDTQQVSDTNPVIGDVLDTSTSYSTAPLNSANLGRFRMLYDKCYAITSERPTLKLNIFRRFYKHHVRYNGSASTDINKGGIYIMILGGEASNGPSMNYSARTTFYDN